ncbi:MAG: transglutaminase-like domain-containing protein [Oscillospiraceae bacterium]|nr:transglutaminase-like domain-containing protein [Oscillospiraceae bacterium]
MKKFIAFILILTIGICVVNSETDFFLHFGDYVPQAAENFPEAVDTISELSMKLSDITDMLPSPAEIVAMIKNEEMPIDPSDIAVNAYISDSPMLSFYPDENISIMVTEDGNLAVFGITPSVNKKNLIVQISDVSGETLEQSTISVDGTNRFNKTVAIPETEYSQLDISVYTGSKLYGEYESWVYNYVKIARDENGNWDIAKSPIYEHNKEMYEKDKSTSDALKRTPSIQTESTGIISIAEQLTQNCETDYQRILAIHDWVCSYIRYDMDSLNSEEVPPYYAEEVVQNRSAVCLGFATLFAALCRSIDIPCNVVSGYALGVGSDTEWSDATIYTENQNHAWNEAYVDGRWVIVDTTWDCVDKIENGSVVSGTEVSHLYFDANLEFFSLNHKILEYSKRR